jgi:predicted Zn-dependent peptidase
MHAVDRSHAPIIQDFTLFKLQKPECHILSNGIPLKIFSNPQLDLLHFIIKIKAGSLYESKKNAAVFCYLLLKESAPKYSSSEVDEFLDYYGVNYTATLSIEYATINLVIPKQNCAKVIPYIFDFLAHPLFKEQNMDILRKRKLMDLAYNREKVSYCASQLMLHHIFGDSCKVGKILDENDLNSITLHDLQEHHWKSFCAENIRLFATGHIDNNILSFLTKLFESIPQGTALSIPALPPLTSHATEPIIDKHENSVQSAIYLCRGSIGYKDPKRMDFSILSTILGGYFGSRLMSNLRETNGYTYGINCDSLFFEDSSIFYIESEVNVDVTRQAIEECFKELDKLCHEPVPIDELRLVQNYMVGQLLRKVDNSVSYMTQYSRWSDVGSDESEFERQMHSIKTFDSEKSMILAQQLMQQKDFITIVSGNIN